MRIAYILYPEAIVINKANGIRNQAIAWKRALAPYCRVDLLSPWDEVDWSVYDLVHIFGGNQWLGFMPDLKAYNSRIVFSPVLDSIEDQRKLRFQANLGFKGYHHAQNMYRQYLQVFSSIFVRSDYEASYFRNCYAIEDSKIIKIPISFDFTKEELEIDITEKSPFCLHISALYQERKNIPRLIEAAKKYGFELKLGGSTGNDKQTNQLKSLIGDAPNIELMGFIPSNKIIGLYAKASVFALPSINEGVGIVALNAAALGCNIVITTVGGPKEYFTPFAEVVDPYSVDGIGRGVIRQLQSISPNLDLRNHVINNFSEEAIGTRIFKEYQKICLFRL